jgi:hypothetical protein
LGIYWAARMPTARAAGVPTGLIGFAAVAVPVVLMVLMALATDGRVAWFLLPGGAAPPVALWLSALQQGDLAVVQREGPYWVPLLAAGTAAGVVVYAGLAWRLWRGACRRFQRTAG